jgi:hypothetical protein
VTEAEAARAAEEEAAATKLAAEEAEAAATKLAAEEVEEARAAEEEAAGPAPPLDKEASPIAMKSKGGGKAAEVTEVEVARAAEEEAAVKAKEVARVEEEAEAAATKLAAEEARAAEEEAVGPAPPLDKEASAIGGQQGDEGLGGCGRRELCCGAGAGKKIPGHPTFHTPYYGLFRWPLFGHFGAEIPTSVLLELVPVGA